MGGGGGAGKEGERGKVFLGPIPVLDKKLPGKYVKEVQTQNRKKIRLARKCTQKVALYFVQYLCKYKM